MRERIKRSVAQYARTIQIGAIVLLVVSGAIAPAVGSPENSVTFSGETVISGDPATDGASFQYETNDIDSVSNLSIDVTGAVTEKSQTESGSGVSASGSASVSVAGDLEPSGPSSAEPQLSLTGHRFSKKDSTHYEDVGIDHGGSVSYTFSEVPETLHQVSATVTQDESGSADFEVYAITNGQNYTVASSYVTSQKTVSGTLDVATGSSVTIKIRLTGGDDFYTDANSATITGLTPENVDVTASDGATASFGSFSDGETKTKAINLSSGVSALNFSGSGGTLDYSLSYDERYLSDSPAIEVNGHWTNYSGKLNKGETVSLAANSSWIAPGTNRVNVSTEVGTVGLSYSHTSVENRTVEYSGEEWSERYNVSRTWGARTHNATLTIPFAGNVISNRKLELYINGTQTSVAWSRFRADSTKLEVGLGNLDPGATTRVVAAGSKVRVPNGSVEVIKPTAAGNKLNSTIKIADSDASGVSIDVSNTSSRNLVHYLENPSWQFASAHAVIEDGGARQTLRLPNASAGGTARVRTIPLAVQPQTDAEIEIVEPDEPRFQIRPSDTSGDSMTYKWHAADSGTTYELVSATRDGYVIDTDEANSPAVLSEDNDDSETLFIREASSGGSSDSSGSGSLLGGGGVPPIERVSGPLANPVALLVIAVLAVLGAGIAVSSTGAKRWVALAAVGVVVLLSTVALIPDTVGMVLTRFGIAGAQGFASVSSVLWLAGGGLALYAAYRVVQRFTGRKDVNLRVTRGGK